MKSKIVIHQQYVKSSNRIFQNFYTILSYIEGED